MSRRPSRPRMPRPERAPERVAWFEGAPLRHEDLRDAVAHEARLLALHVGAMHGAWGAALGLSVVVGTSRRDVVVTPGLAYDCRGEALVLADAVRLDAPRAAPATSGGAAPGRVAFDLVASRAPEPEGAPCERIIACEGPVRAAGLRLRWEMAGPVAAGVPALAPAVRHGDDVPLARLVRRGDGTLEEPDHAVRRIARALTRPHVARGAVPAGALAWRDEGYRLVATVDAADAGFTTAPRWFVSMTAPPAWDAASVVPLLAVAAARAASFDVALSAAARGPGALPAEARLRGAASLSLAWVGVEMTRGCPPALRLDRIAALAGGLVDAASWLHLLAPLGATSP